MLPKIRWFVAPMMIGSLLSGWAQTNDPAAKPVAKVRSAREFNGLCRRARTADDYKGLCEWCDGRSSFCARRVKELEAELKDYYSGTQRVGLKYPPRDQTLKELIDHYRVQGQKWAERGDSYRKQVAKLTAAETVAAAQPK